LPAISALLNAVFSKNGLNKVNASSFGFATHPLFTIEENLFYDRVHNLKFFYQVDELKKYVEQEQSLISKINPDLIVSDFRLTLAISAELAGKPLLNLSNSYWSPNYSCKFPPPESGIFNLLPSKTTNFIFDFIRPFFFRNFGKELNQTREYFGLTRKKDFRELYTAGTYTAYMDIPQFVKINNLPENHFYLGPVIWAPDANNLSIALKNKNNVYISMGSTGDNSLIPEIIKAVLNNDLNVVLSGINASEKSALFNQIPKLVGRSIIEPLIQADEILPFCKLTICHGGSGTVYQSIAKGIPVLCFPKNTVQR
jgi:UDP:flavonoid glycosyltransferase YjiC (YdhE family)